MKSVLMLPLEFTKWQQARAWSYTGSYSFIDGFEQNDISCLSLPLYIENTDSYASKLIETYKKIVDDKYDEVWVWCVHTQLSEDDWKWINSLTNKVVGVVMESVQYTDEEYQEFPTLRNRSDLITQELSHCSHALVANQSDADFIKAKLGIEAIWYLPMIGEQHVLAEDAPTEGKACFIGSCYKMREPYLKHGKLDQIIERPDLPERHCSAPAQFDQACSGYIQECLFNDEISLNAVTTKYSRLKAARENLFDLQLKGIRMGQANVNLPSLFKGYPGRVIESMAASVPVLSSVPLCGELATVFENGEDILIFDSPETLQSQFELLVSEEGMSARIVKSARNKLLLRHTARIRIQQFSKWLDDGISPNFYQDNGYRPSFEECLYYDKLFNRTPNWSALEPNSDEKSRWKVIKGYIDELDLTNDNKIIEVGCGRGWLSELLVNYCPVIAIEPVPEVTLRNMARSSSVEYMVGSAETQLFLNKREHYDLLVCSEVMEHIPKKFQAEFVENLVALVSIGGYLIISTPRADIQQEWMKQYGDPAQPIEDWIMEKDLESLFSDQKCQSIKLERAFLLDIYQVWLFKKLS